MESYELKQVPYDGYGKYYVSLDGRVYRKSKKGFRILKQRVSNWGYDRVVLSSDYVKRSFYTHRIVWETFVGTIPDGMQINHKDENKLNNALDNLELCTPKYNSNYGTRGARIAAAQTGEKNHEYKPEKHRPVLNK